LGQRKNGDIDIGYINQREHGKESLFGYNFIYMNKVANTIMAGDLNVLFSYPRYMNKNELIKVGSFPEDYNFLNIKPRYIIGMSVPPLMIANIADRVYSQWLTKINKR